MPGFNKACYTPLGSAEKWRNWSTSHVTQALPSITSSIFVVPPPSDWRHLRFGWWKPCQLTCSPTLNTASCSCYLNEMPFPWMRPSTINCIIKPLYHLAPVLLTRCAIVRIYTWPNPTELSHLLLGTRCSACPLLRVNTMNCIVIPTELSGHKEECTIHESS